MGPICGFALGFFGGRPPLFFFGRVASPSVDWSFEIVCSVSTCIEVLLFLLDISGDDISAESELRLRLPGEETVESLATTCRAFRLSSLNWSSFFILSTVVTANPITGVAEEPGAFDLEPFGLAIFDADTESSVHFKNAVLVLAKFGLVYIYRTNEKASAERLANADLR